MEDWVEIQKYYDEKNTLEETSKYFGIGLSKIYKKVNEGLLKTRSRSENSKIFNRGRKHTQEVKNKISKSLTNFYNKNPDKIPYRVYHSSKESYPEKYFSEVFEKEGMIFFREYHVKNYSLDFAIPTKKIDIEIDGDQHYRDERVIESDRKRNEYLQSMDWKIIRIKWSDYQKLNNEEKTKYIQDLKFYINGLIDTLPDFEIKTKIKTKERKERAQKKSIEKKEKSYKKDKCKCGNIKAYEANKCLRCENDRKDTESKINSTDLQQLLYQVNEFGYCGTSKIYGVSDNTIRKWIKKLVNKMTTDDMKKDLES